LENRDLFTEVCAYLEAMARNIFPSMDGRIAYVLVLQFR
jgi:hypothetical protein